MPAEHYATSYQSENYCAAYRAGVLTLVRLRDGHSCTLSLAETNAFRRDVFDYELSDDERNPIDRACAKHHRNMKKRKHVYATFEGAIISFHNEPVRAET